MCKTQCLLAVIALSIPLANSWDIAITAGDQLEFYTNQTKTNNEGMRFKDLTALAYDAVHNMLLFVDRQNDNASIFSYHLATKKYQSLVRRRSYESIQGLAFDPITSLLFWTDHLERSIFFMSLKPGSKNDLYGNRLIEMDDELPRAIAVDSCRGYIYWTNTNTSKPTIERARFNGTDRTVVVNTDIFYPTSIAIDQRTKRLYWADDKAGIHYSIESSDLNGKDRKTLLKGTNHQPNALTISKDSIYWVDWDYKTIWKLAKDAPPDTEPTALLKYNNNVPFGIVANYKISDQLKGVEECAELQKLSLNKSAINDTFNIPKDIGLFCLHGVKLDGKLECKCSPGYTGERCEMSVCQNYCLQGDCTLSPEGEPMCRCKNGFSGSRCEVNACTGYCLNNGVCRLNDTTPTCQCLTDYEGSRCESLKVFTTTTVAPQSSSQATPIKQDQQETPIKQSQQKAPIKQECNCTVQHQQLPEPTNSAKTEEFMVSSCDQSDWDNVRDPVIVVLGVLSGLLCVSCTYLVTKVLQLKKRPRIKKRIIVNKNVTPMTARPDQCEITIENCCNMNICETPCFEPRSTIRPTLGDAKPGKEEKRNLIANMEYPEEY